MSSPNDKIIYVIRIRRVGGDRKITLSGLTGFYVICCSELNNPEQTLLAMLSGKVNLLPNHIQSVYVQNILKILNIILKEASQEHIVEVISILRILLSIFRIVSNFVCFQLCETICSKLPQFVNSGDLEVQERASSALQLINLVKSEIEQGNTDVLEEFDLLFQGELNPVAAKAQRKVQVPEG